MPREDNFFSVPSLTLPPPCRHRRPRRVTFGSYVPSEPPLAKRVRRIGNHGLGTRVQVGAVKHPFWQVAPDGTIERLYSPDQEPIDVRSS